ncbi:hypothetical protein GX865_04895 [Candidatus Saccharibacteria bacterium]|nr:hypothetical protein [Candidatus Saccharibacteria bacterium]
MATVGLTASIITFLLFFVFLEAIVKSPFFCVVFSVAAAATMAVTEVGYGKSYKTSKNNIRTLRDRLKMFSSLVLNFLILLVIYHVFFDQPGLKSLIFSLPYLFVVTFICWFAGFLTIKVKMRKAHRKNAETP